MSVRLESVAVIARSGGSGRISGAGEWWRGRTLHMVSVAGLGVIMWPHSACPSPATVLTWLGAPSDQFPCQFQLFYRGKARRSMWYDPVFRVRPSALVSAACYALD